MTKNNVFDKKIMRSMKLLAFIGLTAILLFGIVAVNKTIQHSVLDFFETVEKKGSDFEFYTLLQNSNTERSKQMQWFAKNKYYKDSVLNPPHILLGAHDDDAEKNFGSIFRLEQKLETTFPLIQIYVPWGSRREQKFPVTRVKNIINKGSLPLITWEPWLQRFESRKYPQLRSAGERNEGGMADIANGLYDEYILEWAREIKKIKVPIFIRWGHEMNDAYRYAWGPQNNKSYEYIHAWRHLHKLFTEQNVDNVIWVWCPHISYLDYDEYYPGHEYVDYIGMNILNYGEAVSWAGWLSFSELFDKHYTHFSYYDKPIMIAEFATLKYGGDKNQWYAEALDSFPQKYPMVKSLLFFHVSEDNTTSLNSLDWQFIDDSVCTSIISEKINQWKDF
ncbi:MAG: glycoside hydrolase family 26 protein [Bacteroidota bacterium]